jgi:hypothetical protein
MVYIYERVGNGLNHRNIAPQTKEAGTSMLNVASVDAVNKAKFSLSFVRPCYDTYCFANLPATILYLLTGQRSPTPMLPTDVFGRLPTRYEKVIFFFIDAFGWSFYERYIGRYDFLKAVIAQGVVSKLTSQFPSTTAAHVTCIHTGLDVGQSGVYEWNYYEPLVDEVISPLPFSFAGDKAARDTVKRSSVPASKFFPQQTFYHTLRVQGVTSHIFQHQAYSASTYSEIVFRGATVHPYRASAEAFAELSEMIRQPVNGPTYYFFYLDRIDTVCHNHGPDARQTLESIETFLSLMDQYFYRNLRGKRGNTLLLLAADHGQVAVNPRTTYYLNKRIPDLVPLLKRNRRGYPIVPAGSPRDMFLYVEEEHIDEAVARLQHQLAGKAEVYRTRELLDQHFFGLQEPSPVFLARLGNVVILPYKHETVWWYEEGRFGMHFLGHHGGLTPEEMEIPLLALPL